MSKYIIDTDAGTCVPYSPAAEKPADKMVQFFQANRGAKEYEGIVKTIQTWFYGHLVQAAWCATSVCYAARVMAGLSGFPKKDNVYELYTALKSSTYGMMIDRKNIKNIQRGDILFFLWDGDKMTAGSSKHVGLAEFNADYDTAQSVFCIGGNQSDKICTKAYSQTDLYAIFRLH